MLSKNSLIGLSIFLLNTSIFAQTNHNNRLKDVTANLREARTVVDIAISDDNLYIVNKGIGSDEQPLFEKTKTATSWSGKTIPGDLTDNSHISALEATTDDTGDEILLFGTRNDEVRKYDDQNGWLNPSSDAEIGLPDFFEVSAMTKYIDQSTPFTYTIIGLRNVSGPNGNGTLFRAEMNDLNSVTWLPLELSTGVPFTLPVADVVVSKHNTDIIYVAVNDGLGELGATVNGVNQNGIWWSINGGVTFTKLESLSSKID